MKGATRSASPITRETPMKTTRGRYSCNSALIVTSQRCGANRNGCAIAPWPIGPAPPKRLGKPGFDPRRGDIGVLAQCTMGGKSMLVAWQLRNLDVDHGAVLRGGLRRAGQIA